MPTACRRVAYHAMWAANWPYLQHQQLSEESGPSAITAGPTPIFDSNNNPYAQDGLSKSAEADMEPMQTKRQEDTFAQ